VLGAGWQLELAEALLMRWQVLGLLRKLCSCTLHSYLRPSDFDGIAWESYEKRRKCLGSCREWVQLSELQYNGCTVTLYGLDH
jgi:hypothetical protein